MGSIGGIWLRSCTEKSSGPELEVAEHDLANFFSAFGTVQAVVLRYEPAVEVSIV